MFVDNDKREGRASRWDPGLPANKQTGTLVTNRGKKEHGIIDSEYMAWGIYVHIHVWSGHAA